eukprot:TRINITY_DN45210_c0_g1_i1.p1 TRINITY_DN45210_c0_g1~~TRINITY_DN45210_c0_g1_i1.p1  ORF type:complete len:180 (-),score=34.54 TRINITY_DN45210_c0_g1_i1:8-547(-)
MDLSCFVSGQRRRCRAVRLGSRLRAVASATLSFSCAVAASVAGANTESPTGSVVDAGSRHRRLGAQASNMSVVRKPVHNISNAKNAIDESDASTFDLVRKELSMEDRSKPSSMVIVEDQAVASFVGLIAVGSMMALGAYRYRMRRRKAREERLLNTYACELASGGDSEDVPRLPTAPIY